MTRPIIILTRDEAGNQKLAGLLETASKHVKSFNIFQAEYISTPAQLPTKHIIVTSRHGALAIQNASITKDVIFYAVGDEAAEIITQAGYDVAASAPNVATLMDKLKQASQPSFSYFRGEHITTDINTVLAASNITIHEHIAYSYQVDDAALGELVQYVEQATSPLIFPLLSARSARIVSDAIFNCSNNTETHAVLLSQTIADAIGHHACCLLYTSPSPRDQRGSRMPSSA